MFGTLPALLLRNLFSVFALLIHMMRKFRVLIIYVTAFSFFSCESNAISFDIRNQEVKSCDGKRISRLSIENDSIFERFNIFCFDSIKTIPTSINLIKLPDGYFVQNYVNNLHAPSRQLILSASSSYTITMSGGDVGSYKIRIWTDTSRLIYKTSTPFCE